MLRDMQVSLEQLPVMGLGASLSLSSRPDPIVLASRDGGPDFVEYAGLVEVDAVLDEVSKIRAAGIPVLFHPSYINFCGSFANSTAWLEATARHVEAVGSPWFAQDCAYCFWRQGPGYSTQLGYFVPPVFSDVSLQYAIERVREVQAMVAVPVVVEPPPVTFIVGSMPLFSFFGELSRATGCGILLDMGHLVSYEMASGRRVADALVDLPCERVVEVHIAGGRLSGDDARPVYVDAHECNILPETWHMFDAMLPELSGVKALCYECEGVDEHTVMRTLKKIRRVVMDKSGHDALLARIADRV